MYTCLLVDDDESIRSLIKDIMESEDFCVIEACNGDEALKNIAESAPDIIITDLVMPGKNGIDLIMEVNEKYPGLPMIAMSGGGGITGTFDYLPVAGLLGAARELPKPFSPDYLVKLVHEMFDVRK